ncbi:hypothetical protein [uncultured Rubinisphaera sp.]|uniref:type II secretion system protein n=1 Tax=uncultured Rubinisphaera sp. TaxID=1678686 RepID=UPI0030DB414F
MKTTLKCRRGFTAIELISVSFLLTTFAVLIPNPFLSARESARSVHCKNNLRQYGISLYTFSDRDPQSRICSGSGDYLFDGCVDTYGFTADLVNQGAGSGKEISCLSNSVKGLSTLNDLTGQRTHLTRGFLTVPLSARFNAGRCLPFKVDTNGDGSAETGQLDGGTPERTEIVQSMIDAGYTSNYTASWFLARQGVANKDAASILNSLPETKTPYRLLELTQGPLSLRVLEQSDKPSSLIPFLADSSASATLNSKLELSQESEDENPGSSRSRRRVMDKKKSNEENPQTADPAISLGEAFTNGPVQWDETEQSFEPLTPEKVAQLEVPENTWKQDTRQWGFPHQISGQPQLNVLMADGSVKVMNDKSNDGILNPGFTADSKQFGEIEAETFEIFLGTSLIAPRQSKGKFE